MYIIEYGEYFGKPKMYPKRKKLTANEIINVPTVAIASGAALPSSFPIRWDFSQKNKIEKNEKRPIVMNSIKILMHSDE